MMANNADRETFQTYNDRMSGLHWVEPTSPEGGPDFIVYTSSPRRKTLPALPNTPPSVPRLPPQFSLPKTPPEVARQRVSFMPEQARLRPKGPSAIRKPTLGRDSAYYAGIPASKSKRNVTTEEREFGWAGSARHFRKSRVAPAHSQASIPPFAPANLPASPTSDDSEYSANILSGYDGSEDGKTAAIPSNTTDIDSMPAWWMRFLRKVMKKSRVKSDTMSRSDSGCSVSTSSSLRVDDITMTDDDFTRPVNEEEVRAFRAARDKFLKQRQYRGSIFYDEMSGVAKIPLYAAPKSANMTAAPALSSFAPIAPLGAKQEETHRLSVFPTAHIKDGKALAQAIATVNADGNIIEIRRNKRQSIFVRADAPMRFSRFLDIEESNVDRSSGFAY